MRTVTLLPPLFALLLTGFAPAPFPKAGRLTAAEADLRAMQGRWDRVFLSYGKHDAWGGEANVRIAGDRVAFYIQDRLRDEWSISLRPQGDVKRFEAKVISGDHKGSVVTGTYRLDSGVLALTYEVTANEGGFFGRPVQLSVVLVYRKASR